MTSYQYLDLSAGGLESFNCALRGIFPFRNSAALNSRSLIRCRIGFVLLLHFCLTKIGTQSTRHLDRIIYTRKRCQISPPQFTSILHYHSLSQIQLFAHNQSQFDIQQCRKRNASLQMPPPTGYWRFENVILSIRKFFDTVISTFRICPIDSLTKVTNSTIAAKQSSI